MSNIKNMGLQVITVPKIMKKHIEKVNAIKKVKQQKADANLLYKGNKFCPVITCKNKELNFYKGQTYRKFEKVTLASQYWTNKKYKGDYFKIEGYAPNPAFDEEDSDTSFEDLGLDLRIVEELQKNGIEKPTNIQALAIPHVLERSNCLIAAETGNGKTYSFIAPIIHQILNIKENLDTDDDFNSPYALVIVPGRELAVQITDMARLIGNNLGINVESVIGGNLKQELRDPTVKQTDILITTFGAITKLIKAKIYKFHRINHVVLDEADTLLDDSFNEYVTHFLSKLYAEQERHKERDHGIQLSLVGATFPTSVQQILKKIIDVESMVHLKTNFLHKIPPHIPQKFLRVGTDERSEKLLHLAKVNLKLKIPTLIFSNSWPTCKWIAGFLTENNVPCLFLSGHMKARERMDIFRLFQDKKYDLLSTTDLVSRGLDTIRARHVLNFEFPSYIADYVHRCGRIGRVGAEQKCEVTNFIRNESDVMLAQHIEYSIRKGKELPNVNANIKRAISNQMTRDQYMKESIQNEQMNKEEMEKELEELLT